MKKIFSIFCLIPAVFLFSSCDMPDYTDEINAAYFNASGSSGSTGTATCTYGEYECSNNDSYFCAYSGNDLLWQLSETCSYGCDSSTGKCKSSNNSGSGSNSSSDSGSGSSSGGNNSGGDSGNSGGNSDTSSPLCNPNPCANLANSTGICTTTHDDYVCGCKEGYNWRHKECTQIPKALGNICTGQTKCYTDSDLINCNSSSIGDFYGQDAYYAARGTCIPQKFRIDNSVPNEKTVIDENTGLEWQQTIPSESCSWENAIKYCEELEYGGHNDWRLPTVKELFSIVDINTYNPAIDTTYFSETHGIVWSSSSYVSMADVVWKVDFEDGHNDISSSSNYPYAYVSCVREKPFSKTSTFTSSTIKGDEIITDSETGLIWQKTYDETEKKWSDALAYCENLTYAGYSDWRMPNINELLSLVNYEEYDPASDFPDMPSEYFWSSSTRLSAISYDNNDSFKDDAWMVHFGDGNTYYCGGKSYGEYVRCVR